MGLYSQGRTPSAFQRLCSFGSYNGPCNPANREPDLRDSFWVSFPWLDTRVRGMWREEWGFIHFCFPWYFVSTLETPSIAMRKSLFSWVSKFSSAFSISADLPYFSNQAIDSYWTDLHSRGWLTGQCLSLLADILLLNHSVYIHGRYWLTIFCMDFARFL